MPTLNLQIGANANDAGGRVGIDYFTNSAFNNLGNVSDADAQLWDRFLGCSALAGATLQSALISYRCLQTGTFTAKTACEDADSSSMPTTDAAVTAKTMTAYISSGTKTPLNDEWVSWDITAAVQAVVSRPGFGSTLGIRSRNNSGTGFARMARREWDTTLAAKLDVTYTAPAPTVTNVTPNSGPATGGTDVTITGTGFAQTPTITFGGTPATNIFWISSTWLICTTPAHAAGAVDVVVTNPDTQAGTGTDAFTYSAPATSCGSPVSAGCPKVDLSFRSFNVGQPGGYF